VLAIMKQNEINKIVQENRSLFWSVSEKDLSNISTELVVETILTYGNEKSVKKLINILGIKKVADIFFKQISQKRCNYPARTHHYFNLYFKKYA